ncbi:MAG: pantoate--beta-alanine ligase, partial [Thermoleophilaceae bacterium]
MRTVRTIAELHAALATQRRRTDGGPVGLVPTMGSFHEGHLSLLRRACELTEVVVASLFVHPAQFGPAEDIATYPCD